MASPLSTSEPGQDLVIRPYVIINAMPYSGGAGEHPAPVGESGPWQPRLRLAALVGAVACTGIALLSFVPVPPVPDALWGLLFFGAIAINFPTVISFKMRTGRSRIPSGEVYNLLIRRHRWIYLVVALAAVSFVYGIISLRGQPEIQHGQFFLDDHGTLIQVSHATYLRGMAAQQRMFASFAAVFYSVATILNSALPPEIR